MLADAWDWVMRVNVNAEVGNLLTWPLRHGDKVIVKPYGRDRWVIGKFLRISFPSVYILIDGVAHVLSALELGTRWIRCRRGKHGRPVR